MSITPASRAERSSSRLGFDGRPNSHLGSASPHTSELCESRALDRNVIHSSASDPGVLAFPATHIFRVINSEMATILSSTIFDADWYTYRTERPVANRKSHVRHYLMLSLAERVDPSPLFSRAFYLEKYGLDCDCTDPLVHYLREGWKNCFDPHPLFSVRFYLDNNQDVSDAGCEPLQHYLDHGWREGRSPCADFDTAYYLRTNADVRDQGCEPLSHFVHHGAAEGRNPLPVFDTSWYAKNVLQAAPQNPLVDYRNKDSNGDGLFRCIRLSDRHEMSAQDFGRWKGSFPSPSAEGENVGLVRINESELREAAKAARKSCPETAQERCVYLVCHEADDVDALLIRHLAEGMAHADLGIFDFAFAREGLWAPVLLPGANATHIEAVDATFSRFAISSSLLRELDVDDTVTAYQILKAAIARLREIERLGSFIHVAVPILQAEDLSRELREKRVALAAAWDKGPQSRDFHQNVSVVICTKDRCRLLSQLVDSLLDLSPLIVRDIVVVSNADVGSFAAQVHARYAETRRVKLLRHEGPYNLSQQSNLGASHCSGDLLLFLNDDIVPVARSWLEFLKLPFFARPEIGVSGPLLLDNDERAQHAGMYLAAENVVHHVMRGSRVPDEDYIYTASAPRDVSAVTGAALLTRRALFEDLNGFDLQLATCLHDVDYCLRVRASGHSVVYEPRAVLLQMESVSMRAKEGERAFPDDRPLERAHFLKRWKTQCDRDDFHNPSFDASDERLRVIALG